MRVAIRLVLVVGLSAPIPSAAQAQSRFQSNDAEATVKALTDRLRFREADPTDRRRYYEEMADATARLRTAIDRYIAGLVSTTSSDVIQAMLRTVLSQHKPLADYGDDVFAQAAELSVGRSLLVAYTIVRPPHHDIATIRGYRATVDGFELVATAGDDFEGYGMFKRALPSPFPGELWMMAWGQAHTFNGTRIRFRVYAFDGLAFRTMWSPEDMFNATVRFTDAGFAIDHDVPLTGGHVHEEYAITQAGPVRTASK
jgi:hypothetical protein